MPTRDDLFPSEDGPLWYKDAVIYEVNVRAFRTVTPTASVISADWRKRTLYTLQNLGVTTLWLLPF